MDWFEKLTGFKELGYAETRNLLSVRKGRLHSAVNGESYATGTLSTPSVKELREEALRAGGGTGTLKVAFQTSDIRRLHIDTANRGALFQVASQFNLLEMIDPGITPEHGVTRYAHDHTQGPACAISAGAATIYRNYFADVSGTRGQTRFRQIDCLREVGEFFGNDGKAIWEMRNGYALCTKEGLAIIDQWHGASTIDQISEVRDRLRVGLHSHVEVTTAPRPYPTVSQVFCSALPPSYSVVPLQYWRTFASLVLEGAYEATLWAGVLNATKASCNVVYLTRLGGGAFGNDRAWINAAIRRSLELVRDFDLDVRIVTLGTPDPDLISVVQSLQRERG